jgi:hypothetical protein
MQPHPGDTRDAIRRGRDEQRHESDAEAKLRAGETMITNWIETPARPSQPDLVALRRLLHAARVHFKVVRTS